MVQNTLVIQNQAAQAAREDIEEAIQAVATNNSYVNTGSPPASVAPPQTYPNMWWYDPHTNLLQIRNEGDTSWLNGFYINQSSGAAILDDTYVLKTNGQVGGVLGDQSTATWEAGTGTTESLVSPAKVKASVIDNMPDTLGVSQTWQDMSGSRDVGTSYQNSTGRPIMVSVCTRSTIRYDFQVSTNNSTWVSVGALAGYGNLGDEKSAQVIVPDDHYYKVTGGTLKMWAELR